jgi:hypothetical protein
MTPTQQQFFDDFTIAINQYLNGIGTVNPSISNTGKPIERLVNRIINDCRYESEIPTLLRVNLKHCPLSIFLFKYFHLGHYNYLHGIIIIVSDGRRSVCFHFPLNTTNHTIANAYFDGTDPLLRAYFLEATNAPAGYGCYLQLFDSTYKVEIFPQTQFGIGSILNALDVIEHHCHNIFCS